jgi:predicted permease
MLEFDNRNYRNGIAPGRRSLMRITRLHYDLAHAVRSLSRSWTFTLVAVFSLALAIGANTAIFTLVEQLVLQMLPVQHPEQVMLVVGMGRHYGTTNGRNVLSYPMYQDLRDRQQVFSLMMCRYRFGLIMSAEAGHSEVVAAELVSGNYFPMLGLKASLGRLYTASDDLYAGRHPYVVLSYAFWQSRFGGDPTILGRTIRVNNTYPLTVVGVAQKGFDGLEPGLTAHLFIPMSMAAEVRPGFRGMFDRRQRWLNVLGRLKPGVTSGEAQAALRPLFHQITGMEVQMPAFRNATPFDKEQFTNMWPKVIPGSQGNGLLRQQYENPLWVLTGVTGIVMLIAFANLAGLMSVRAMARQKEIAVRAALGATQGHIIRQLLTEAILLSFVAGLLGVALAVVTVKGLLKFLPDNITGYSLSSAPNWHVLAFAFVISLLAGVVCGLFPALPFTRLHVADVLKAQTGGIAGRVPISLRKLLVTGQVSLSVILLIAASLFIHSLSNLYSLNLGFQTTKLVEFPISPGSVGYDPQKTREFYRRLEDRLGELPGVRSAGLANIALLTGAEWHNPIVIQGYTPKRGEDMEPHLNAVSSGYFETLGIRVLAGRGFLRNDVLGTPKVAVVNTAFAVHFFGTAGAIGRHIGLGSDPGTPTDLEIVGVVNDSRYEGLRNKVPLLVYLSAAQLPRNISQWVYVSTTAKPTTVSGSIRRLLSEMDGNMPMVGMKTVEEQVNEALASDWMLTALLSTLSVLATVLAVIGLYGVIAYLVTCRSREIGIRVALGAQRGEIVWLMMREVFALVGAGVTIGVLAALWLTPLARAQLYELAPHDPDSIIGATGMLVLVAIIAGYIPTRRATGSDPVHTLRQE